MQLRVHLQQHCPPAYASTDFRGVPAGICKSARAMWRTRVRCTRFFCNPEYFLPVAQAAAATPHSLQDQTFAGSWAGGYADALHLRICGTTRARHPEGSKYSNHEYCGKGFQRKTQIFTGCPNVWLCGEAILRGESAMSRRWDCKMTAPDTSSATTFLPAAPKYKTHLQSREASPRPRNGCGRIS
jgi:hypothetical protein